MRVPKQPYRLASSMRPVLVPWLCWCLIATAARVARIRRAISSLMLQHVCWATRSPCCATPRCLVRTRINRVAPSRGPPDPGGYSTIHSSPILRTAVQRSAARRGVRHVSFTATVALGRLQPPGIAKSLIKDTHRRHLSMSACASKKGRLAGLLTARSTVVTYSAGLHTMSHRITMWP